jgi:hypothetical protein
MPRFRAAAAAMPPVEMRRHRLPRQPPVPAPALLEAPTGFRLAVPADSEPEVVTGQALVGRTVLFRWPTAGWVRGTLGASWGAAVGPRVSRT